MHLKYIILFLILTLLLIVLAYFLLDVIDRHGSYPLIIFFGLVILGDIAAMAGILKNKI